MLTVGHKEKSSASVSHSVTYNVQYLCNNTFDFDSTRLVVEIQNGRFLRQMGGRGIFGSFFRCMPLDNTISRRDRVGVLVDGGNSVECCDMTLSYTKPIPVEIDHLKC